MHEIGYNYTARRLFVCQRGVRCGLSVLGKPTVNTNWELIYPVLLLDNDAEIAPT